MIFSRKSHSNLRQIALWLAGLAPFVVACPTSAAAPVVVSIESQVYADEVSRLQKEIEELVQNAKVKEKEASIDGNVSSADGAAQLYAKAAGRSAQQYFMSRSTGRSGATEEFLVRGFVRQSYGLKPDRGSFLNPEFQQARERAIVWLHEHGVEVNLNADAALLEQSIDVLPTTVFTKCEPAIQCPICPDPPRPGPRGPRESPCPFRAASKAEPTPAWQRLGIDFSPLLGASIHRGREEFTFTHMVLGARLGLFGQVWKGARGALGVGGSYVFKAHRIGVPPVVGDTVDLPSLMIYEHSIAVGPRFRVSLPTQRVALYISTSIGLSMFDPFIRSDGSAQYSDPYYKGPRLYGEGVLGLLLAHEVVLLNFFISGTHFGAAARSTLGTSPAHGLTLGGSFGVDLIRLIVISQKLRKSEQ